MGADEEDALFLGSLYLVSFDGGDDHIGFFLKGALQEDFAGFRVKRVRFYQIVRNGRSGFSKHVGDDEIKRNIADSESVLVAVLLASVTGNELEAVAGIFPEDADGLVRDKTARNQTEPEKAADPFGILGVILIALDGFDQFGVGDGDSHLSLQDIEDRVPVLAGRFHANIVTVIVKQPFFEAADVSIESGKAFFPVRRLYAIGGFDDCGNEERFMDIGTTTGFVDNFHGQPPFAGINRRRH